MIPELEENIKYISMKLEENENSTKVTAAEGQGNGASGRPQLQISKTKNTPAVT